MLASDLAQTLKAGLQTATSAPALLEQLTCFFIDDRFVRSTNGRLFTLIELDEGLGFSCFVPATVFYKTIRSIGDREISLAIEKDRLIISTNRVEAKLALSHPDEATDIDEELISSVDDWTKLPKHFEEGLRLCSYAAAKDYSLGALAGVYVCNDAMYSTDRFRISRYRFGSSVRNAFTVPRRLAKAVCGLGHLERFLFENDKIQFAGPLQMGRGVIGGPICRGEFPDVRPFLERVDDGENFFSVPVPDELREAAERQNILQEDLMELDYETRVTLDNRGVELYATHPRSGEIRDRVPLRAERRIFPASFLVNSAFLADVLKLCDEMFYSTTEPMVAFRTDRFIHLVRTREELD